MVAFLGKRRASCRTSVTRQFPEHWRYRLAIGLTTAIVAQQAEARVTIYAGALPPFVRSAKASGSWTPSSRIAQKDGVTSEFATRWEAMARYSFSSYQNLQGLPGNPIEWDTFYGMKSRDPAPV